MKRGARHAILALVTLLAGCGEVVAPETATLEVLAAVHAGGPHGLSGLRLELRGGGLGLDLRPSDFEPRCPDPATCPSGTAPITAEAPSVLTVVARVVEGDQALVRAEFEVALAGGDDVTLAILRLRRDDQIDCEEERRTPLADVPFLDGAERLVFFAMRH